MTITKITQELADQRASQQGSNFTFKDDQE